MTRIEQILFRRRINDAIMAVIDQAMCEGLYPDHCDTVMQLLAIAHEHMLQATKPLALDSDPNATHTPSPF